MKIIRCNMSRGFNRSWIFNIHLGPGAGYRWIDLPGHSNNINDGWRCRHLTILGRTIKIGRNVKKYNPFGGHRILPFYFSFSTNANGKAFPQW